jgi:hypothetical protein
MWNDYFIRLKNELIEIVLTIKEMICRPLLMVLSCLWIVISFQENNRIKNATKLGEQDRENINHQMPDQFIQGGALTVRLSFKR